MKDSFRWKFLKEQVHETRKTNSLAAHYFFIFEISRKVEKVIKCQKFCMENLEFLGMKQTGGILTFHIFFTPQDIFNLWENKFNFKSEIYFPWRKFPKEIEGMNLSNITEIGDFFKSSYLKRYCIDGKLYSWVHLLRSTAAATRVRSAEIYNIII